MIKFISILTSLLIVQTSLALSTVVYNTVKVKAISVTPGKPAVFDDFEIFRSKEKSENLKTRITLSRDTGYLKIKADCFESDLSKLTVQPQNMYCYEHDLLPRGTHDNP